MVKLYLAGPRESSIVPIETQANENETKRKGDMENTQKQNNKQLWQSLVSREAQHGKRIHRADDFSLRIVSPGKSGSTARQKPNFEHFVNMV